MNRKLMVALLAAALMLGSCAPAASPSPSLGTNPTPAIPPASASLVEQAALFSGPGNLRYDTLARLPAGEQVQPLAVYGDFVQVQTSSGTVGFLGKSSLDGISADLPPVNEDSVPWEPYFLPDCTHGFYDPPANRVDYVNDTDGYTAQNSGPLPFSASLRLRIDSTQATGETNNGFIGLMGRPQQGDSWWQGMIRFGLVMDGGYYHIGIYDGTTEDFTYWSLPAEQVRADAPIQVIFDDPKGRTFRLLDGNGTQIAHYDVTTIPSLHLPDGLFPDGVVYVSFGIPAHTTLGITGMQVGVIPSGIWDPSAAPVPGLAALADQKDIQIGTNSELYGTLDVRDCQAMKREFNLVMLDDFKWSGVWLAPGQYDFSSLDQQMDVAERHGWRIRGFMVWSVEDLLPDWLRTGSYSRDQYIQMLKDYEQAIISRYAGRVDEWVIANEAVSMQAQHADFWAKKIGPGYVALAFQWAHEADPDAVLIFNDYNNEQPRDAGTQQMFDGTYDLVRSLKQQGIPIDGVGLEFHLLGPFSSPLPPTREGMLETMKKYAELGVKVYVTELDVDLHNHPGADRYQFQADIYRDVVEACLESAVCPSITMWGISDQNSWLESACPYGWCGGQPDADPLLFDDNFMPKPAYFAVRDALLTDFNIVPMVTPTP